MAAAAAPDHKAGAGTAVAAAAPDHEARAGAPAVAAPDHKAGAGTAAAAAAPDHKARAGAPAVAAPDHKATAGEQLHVCGRASAGGWCHAFWGLLSVPDCNGCTPHFCSPRHL